MMKIKNGKFNISNQLLYKSLFLLTLGMMMFVTGCTNSAATRQTFTEIMSNSNNNTSPVWRGIEPGKTTEAEFAKVVSKDPTVFENLTKSQLRPEGTRYIWYDTEFRILIGVNFHENVASYLELGLPGRGFPFENIINIAGSPTAYIAVPLTEEFVRIKFLYEEIGVVIKLNVKFDPSEMVNIDRNCKFALTESTVVESVNIYFVEQNDLDTMIATLTTDVFTRPGEIPEPWTGTEDVLKLSRCNP